MASNIDIARLAAEALADEKRGTPGPWKTYETEADIGSRGGYWFVNGSDVHASTVAEAGYGQPHGVDAAIIAAARTREPILARAYLDQLSEAAVQRERAEVAERRIEELVKVREEATAHTIVLQRLIETLARGKMPATSAEAPHMSQVAQRAAAKLIAAKAERDDLRDSIMESSDQRDGEREELKELRAQLAEARQTNHEACWRNGCELIASRDAAIARAERAEEALKEERACRQRIDAAFANPK